MERARELERLMQRRAEVVGEMKTRGYDVALDLRLTYLDEEFRRRRRAQPTSFVDKTRAAVGRMFVRP